MSLWPRRRATGCAGRIANPDSRQAPDPHMPVKRMSARRAGAGGTKQICRTGVRCVGVLATSSALLLASLVPVLAAVVEGTVSPSAAGATSSTPNAPTVFTKWGLCVDGTYTVPTGIHAIHIDAAGAPGHASYRTTGDTASGSAGPGGLGSEVEATIAVTPGQKFYADVAGTYIPFGPENVGQGGGPGGIYPAGGAPVNIGGQGGAASWVSTTTDPSTAPGSTLTLCNPTRTQLVLVASGGGGGGGAGGIGHNGGAGGTASSSGGSGANGATNSVHDGGGGGGGTSSNGGDGGAAGHQGAVLTIAPTAGRGLG